MGVHRGRPLIWGLGPKSSKKITPALKRRLRACWVQQDAATRRKPEQTTRSGRACANDLAQLADLPQRVRGAKAEVLKDDQRGRPD